MTTLTYTGTGDAVFASNTATEYSEDAIDLAMMAEADRDLAAGKGAPIGPLFAQLRREDLANDPRPKSETTKGEPPKSINPSLKDGPLLSNSLAGGATDF